MSVHYKYAYYDETGKRRVKTFTAETLTKAKKLSKAWERERGVIDSKPDITVENAMRKYLEAKRSVLSPSTARSYEGILKNHFSDIKGLPLNKISQTDIQMSIARLAESGLSPKTVRNCYGFLSAALQMQSNRLKFTILLPQKEHTEVYCPSNDDIARLLDQIQRDGDTELLRAVMLCAFGPMRRSEACGLNANDIKGNVVYVRRAVVKDPDGNWVMKGPKTKDSYRKIRFPDFVIDSIRGIDGRIIPHTPDYIGDKFRRTLKKMDIPYFRFHDLRHFGASIMMYMGIPQKVIEARGGWASGSPVLRRTYQNIIEAELEKENSKVNDTFEQTFGNILKN